MIPYGKKVTGLFDVTMGSYDGCELCELVGLYVLHRLKEKFPEIDFGLYRDDGLGVLKRTPKTKLEREREREIERERERQTETERQRQTDRFYDIIWKTSIINFEIFVFIHL